RVAAGFQPASSDTVDCEGVLSQEGSMSEEGKGISRRQLIGASAAAGVAAAFGGPDARPAEAQRGAAAAAPDQQLAFVNGRIHTMDGNNTIATTVTIRNGRFAAVGGAAPRAGA